jgi:hypothetical protein
VRVFRQVAPELDRVVMQALAPSPSQRFDTARDMRDALMDACPEVAHINAEDLAAIVVEMAQKELAAIRNVIRTARESGTPSGSAPTPQKTPSQSPTSMDLPPPAAMHHAELLEEMAPEPPSSAIIAQAHGQPDTDAALKAAGIDPRGNAVHAMRTVPIPLVSPEPGPASGARRRVETPSETQPVDRERRETGSDTTGSGREPRFSMEIARDEEAIERAWRKARRKRNRRLLFVAAILTPLLGAALVLGAMALLGRLPFGDPSPPVPISAPN